MSNENKHKEKMGICNICGGWSKNFPPSGSHFLCTERKLLGQPTPNLGDQCPECAGEKFLSRSKFKTGLFLDKSLNYNINDLSICHKCKGQGIINPKK
jgi:hypothetical protein